MGGAAQLALLSALPAVCGLAVSGARPALTLARAGSLQLNLLADAQILLPDAAETVSAAAQTAAENPGWFDSLVVKPFELAIEALGGAAGFGPAIIIFTIGIKLLLFPLTKQQIESTTKMQAIAPAAKALQERYRERDPARLNAELQKLYQDNEVNPLAGCVPALAQIPLFIGLYRALLNLAKEDKLAQPFLWLPSLEGPVADYTEGIGWLTDWVNGAPKYGWSVTGAYLVLPVLLVASQYLSMELLSPKSEDPAQQQSQAILKFLPLMIGWFSLSVPSGLGLYWLTNNVITTASTLIIREMTPKIEIEIPGAGSAAAASPANTKGFGGRRFGEVIESRAQDGSTVRIKPPGSQTAPSTPAQASIVDPSSTVVEATVVEIERDEGSGMAAEEPKKKMAKKQRKKKRN